MASTGITHIDALWNDPNASPLGPGDPDTAAVGALQDLLIAQGAKLPGILDTSHGMFGPATTAALKDFQTAHSADATGAVGHDLLHTLVETSPVSPIASQVYLTLALDMPWTGFTRLVALTARFEAGGKFTARNRNTDRAGLSFGILQWAQKPGRLSGLVRAFQRGQGDVFVTIFGGGDANVAAGLIAHVAKPNGGVNDLGQTIDPNFDLVGDAWNDRFMAAGRDPGFQRVQVQQAVAAYTDSLAAIRVAAPLAQSERALAFLLDVANQHGDGGMRSICKTVIVSGMTEPAFLEAAQNESVRRLTAQFGAKSDETQSTIERRETFRTTSLLSDQPFSPT
jgi:peptidoglycan hydrolase-like protein with peptidoglycan-binding domain